MQTPYFDSHRPTWLEIASGLAIGPSQSPAHEVQPRPGLLPWRALCDAVAPAVLKPPCLVSFTGGRDSSGVLAAATHTASELGAPPPIPVTMRFPAVKSSHESDWQELVIRHLGLKEWEKLSVDSEAGEMDLLGERTLSMLARHGIMWPFNTALYKRVFEAAPDGATVVTGFGGDGLFEGWSWAPMSDVLKGNHSLERRDLKMAGRLLTGHSSATPTTRQAIWSPHWVRPDALVLFTRLRSAEMSSAPRTWSNWVRWWRRRRWIEVARWSLEKIAEGRITVVHPYFDATFHGALISDGGPLGYGSRTSIMCRLFTEVLPEKVIRRTTKATTFSHIGWSVHSRNFLKSWDGTGLDDDVIDVEALRSEWAKPSPDGRSALLLHALWLNKHSHAQDVSSR